MEFLTLLTGGGLVFLGVIVGAVVALASKDDK